MAKYLCTAAGLAALATLGAASIAVPIPFPNYTFCEEEGNDSCPDAQVLDASIAAAAVGGGTDGETVRDCFYITGKLQQDCVYDIEPKCALRVYDKRKPCRDDEGDIIPNQFYEPIIASSNGADLNNLGPTFWPDRVLRLGIAALFDAVDGTVNGLAGNGSHGERGEVTVKIFYKGGPGGGDGRGTTPDAQYVFNFRDCERSDAVRVGFRIPTTHNGAPVTGVNVQCCTDTGQQPLCYDVDFYRVINLIPGRFYCVEVVGGLTPQTDFDEQRDCKPTDTVVGLFDKQCFQGVTNDDKSDDFRDSNPDNFYSKVCGSTETEADGTGTLAFGVTGTGDSGKDEEGIGFNGLYDGDEDDYFELLDLIDLFTPYGPFTYTPGASLKDESAGDVNFYPRPLWDPFHHSTNPNGFDFKGEFGDECFQRRIEESNGSPEAYFAHGICGGYCIKVTLAEHPDTRPNFPAAPVLASRVDMNQDNIINATDLALLLSYWGIVQ